VRFDGAALRRDRLARGLSQRQLGSIAGLSSSAISRLEQGERDQPLAVTLIRLAGALDADLRRWFTDDTPCTDGA
jgi:transcriptional regulator with XRE-family HTH domain